jgi:hypothetical protein
MQKVRGARLYETSSDQRRIGLGQDRSFRDAESEVDTDRQLQRR